MIDANHGQISFADFMQQALYAPHLGYYNSSTIKFGASGDFITAPEIGELFANCLSQQIVQILTCLADPNAMILELGGGTGKLAAQLLRTLHAAEIMNVNSSKKSANKNLLVKYYILEISGNLRARQQQYIQDNCPEFAHKIGWLNRLPKQPFKGIIIANEVMDAMPVCRFKKSAHGWQELCVALDLTGSNNSNSSLSSFIWSRRPAAGELLTTLANPTWQTYLHDLPVAYESEINLALPAWIKTLANTLQQGCILLFDYGFPRREYFHPQRINGTLMCHYQHHAHADPFINVGLQDITSHVDFTTVAAAADAAGLTILGFTNLAAFLLNCGLLDLVKTKHASANHSASAAKGCSKATAPATVIANTPSAAYLRQAQELNWLTSPAEMGELFKVIACGKNFAAALSGFNKFDKQASL